MSPPDRTVAVTMGRSRNVGVVSYGVANVGRNQIRFAVVPRERTSRNLEGYGRGVTRLIG
jgi:hypothetical protein